MPAMAEMATSRLTDDEMTLFLGQCEHLIVDRLVRPESYQRVAIGKLQTDPGSMTDYMGDAVPEIAARNKAQDQEYPAIRYARLEQAQRFLQGGEERISLDIVYDAASEAGALVRMTSECSQYIYSNGRWSDNNLSFDIRIDNFTDGDWMTHEVYGGKKLPLGN